jgi:hypothetical protein
MAAEFKIRADNESVGGLGEFRDVIGSYTPSRSVLAACNAP